MNKIRKFKKALNLGNHYYFKYKNINAIKNYKKALGFNLYHSSIDLIFERLTTSLIDIGNFNEALIFCNKGLEKSGGNIKLLENKSKILKKLGKNKELIDINKKIENFYNDIKNTNIIFNSNCKNKQILIKQGNKNYCY